jgi:hypothetical protein
MIELDFKECDTCRAKPGAPTLCAGCLHNRRVIAQLKNAVRYHVARQQALAFQAHIVTQRPS